MKAGKWYMLTFVITFLYFYIYAVNYVRGATIQDDIDTRFSFSQFSQVSKSRLYSLLGQQPKSYRFTTLGPLDCEINGL